MTLLLTVNKKPICFVTFINAISKVIISEVFIRIVVASFSMTAASTTTTGATKYFFTLIREPLLKGKDKYS
jgi:hypothetical protein